MSGFDLFDSGTKMRVTYGSRTVLTTDGTLVNLLPQSEDISHTFNIVFPDFSKDYVYNWRHLFAYTSLGNQVAYNSACATALSIPPQEFQQETNLLAAPNGTDFFIGRLVLTRTVAPSNTWNTAVIQPLQPMGVSIPLVSGSLLMEAVFGMSRACSIYVSGGQLKLHRQQSVSTPPGGWGIYGTQFNTFNPQNGGGGENVNGGSAGIPVLQVDSRSNATNVVPFNIATNPIYDQRSRRGGPNACTIPNPSSYNYSSTYQAVLTGSFGRRS